MKRVLIISMRDNSTYVTRVRSMLSAHHVQISLANDEEPASLTTRMDMILNSDVVIILATLKLQRSMVSLKMMKVWKQANLKITTDLSARSYNSWMLGYRSWLPWAFDTVKLSKLRVLSAGYVTLRHSGISREPRTGLRYKQRLSNDSSRELAWNKNLWFWNVTLFGKPGCFPEFKLL